MKILKMIAVAAMWVLIVWITAEFGLKAGLAVIAVLLCAAFQIACDEAIRQQQKKDTAE